MAPLIESALVQEVVEGYEEKTNSDSSACSDKHYIEIWRKSTAIIAEHSGTVAKVLGYDGNTYQIWSACNHGTCPGGGGMMKKCTRTFLNRCGFCQASPNCSTSFGYKSGQHVCNDDTYIQYYRIKYNVTPSKTSGTCSDSSLRMHAPDCW